MATSASNPFSFLDELSMPVSVVVSAKPGPAAAKIAASPAQPAYPSFAELDANTARTALVVVSIEHTAGQWIPDEDSVDTLRAEMHDWLKHCRDTGQMLVELMSVSVRDVCVKRASDLLVQTAAKQPHNSWMTGLPTGRQILLLPRARLDALGFDKLCSLVHSRAILTARAAGKPFNAAALLGYGEAVPAHSY